MKSRIISSKNTLWATTRALIVVSSEKPKFSPQSKKYWGTSINLYSELLVVLLSSSLQADVINTNSSRNSVFVNTITPLWLEVVPLDIGFNLKPSVLDVVFCF